MRAATLLSSRRVVAACLNSHVVAAQRVTPCNVPQRCTLRPLQVGCGTKIRSRQILKPFCTAAVDVKQSTAPPRDEVLTNDPANNVSDYIYSKLGINLHQQRDHPLGIIKHAIYQYFESNYPGTFKCLDDLHPIVSTFANFDEVLVPADHVSRSPNDTYYVSSDKVLRCHTSAHQAETLRTGLSAFLLTGMSVHIQHMPVMISTL